MYHRCHVSRVTCPVSRVTRAAVLDMTISRRQEGDRDQALHWPDVRCNDSSIPCINCINSSTQLQTHSHLHMSAMTVILSNFRHCYCHSLVTHLQLLSRALISSWSTYHHHVSRSPSWWMLDAFVYYYLCCGFTLCLDVGCDKGVHESATGHYVSIKMHLE